MAQFLKAVIFDYGNVLCRHQERSDLDSMAALCGMGASDFEKAYWRNRMEYDQGRLPASDYWWRVSPDTSRDGALDKLIELDNLSWARPDDVMVRWAKLVREHGLRIAILSNMPLAMREHLDRDCAWMPTFDQRTFSCDVHMAKPDPAIYKHCLRGLGVSPSDTLFLDDRIENIDAAEALGIHGLLFHDAMSADLALRSQYDLPELDIFG